MSVFISEVKNENSSKKKNEHGDICFLKIISFYAKFPSKKYVPYWFLSKGDNFQFFTNLINSKLISKLVSSD